MAKIHKAVPGSIKIRTTKAGKEYIYIRCYGDDKFIATGLTNTKENIIKAEILLKRAYIQDKKESAPQKSTASIHQLIEKFLAYKRYKELTEASCRYYKSKLYKVFKTDFDYTLTIQENKRTIYIFEKVIEEFFYSANNYSPAYINNILTAIQVFLNWMTDEEYISKNIILYKKYKKVTTITQKIYSQDNIEKIFWYLVCNKDCNNKEFTKKYIVYYYLFLLQTGARRTEALNITWSDINFEKRFIAFKNKRFQTKKDYFPISLKLLRLLDKLKKLGVAYDSSSSLKIKKYNNRVFKMCDQTIKDIFVKALHDLNIMEKGKFLHSIRKTFATKLFKLRDENKIDSYQIAELMRHKNINITNTVYRAYSSDGIIKILDNNDI